MDVDQIALHGPVLSSLFQEATCNKAGFDGLLFGQVQSRTVQTHNDHEEAQSSEERIALVTGALCSASLGSFYNAAGEINSADLRSILHHSKTPDPVLGWVSYRPGPSTNPTMREVMVTHALPTALQSLTRWQVHMPTLLCLINLGKDHNDATFSFGYRMYTSPAMGELPGPMKRISAQVLNVGANQGKHRYDGLWPLPHMEHAESCGPGWENTCRTLSSISLLPQIKQMEDAYNSSLQELKSLIDSAQRSGAYLQGLIAETERLSSKDLLD